MAKSAPNSDEITAQDSQEKTPLRDSSGHDRKHTEDTNGESPGRVTYLQFGPGLSENIIDVGAMTYKSFEAQPVPDNVGAPLGKALDSNDEISPSFARLYIVNENFLRSRKTLNDSWTDFWDANCFSEPPEEYTAMLNENSFTAWCLKGDAPTLLLQAPRDGYGHFSLYFTNPSGFIFASSLACGAIYKYARFLSPQELLVDTRFAPPNKSTKMHDILNIGAHLLILPLRIYEEHVLLVKNLLGSLERRLALLEWELRTEGLSKLTNHQIADCNLLHQNLVQRWQFQKHMSNALMHWLQSFEKNRLKDYLPIEWLKAKLRRQIDISMSFGPRFEALPRRLDNLSSAFFNAIVQRDSRLNMEIAKSSAQIAEESRRDSSSMKTIAVLTLVFLPATSLASIFSMSMFNWQARPGDVVVSGYVWIYFAFAVPLTLTILAAWLLWFRRTQRRHKSDLADIESKYGFLTQSSKEPGRQRERPRTAAPSLPADKFNYARPQDNPKIDQSRKCSYRALWDFIPEAPGELGFLEGDIVTDAYEVNSEWYCGSNKGQSGLFPANHVEKI